MIRKNFNQLKQTEMVEIADKDIETTIILCESLKRKKNIMKRKTKSLRHKQLTFLKIRNINLK
jgi:hypothetical protein